MAKQLLIDTILFEPIPTVLNESLSHPNKPFIVKGVLQRANAKNQNGRIYPKEVLMREVQNYSDSFIRERRALGELDHPESEIINLKNVSHNITEMHWEGDDLMGTVEILPTPSGNILKSLFESNIRVGISSRSLGSLKSMDEETSLVNDDLQLIGFDIVSNPSTKGAFIYPEQASLNEGVTKKSSIISNNKWSSTENIISDILNELS